MPREICPLPAPNMPLSPKFIASPIFQICQMKIFRSWKFKSEIFSFGKSCKWKTTQGKPQCANFRGRAMQHKFAQFLWGFLCIFYVRFSVLFLSFPLSILVQYFCASFKNTTLILCTNQAANCESFMLDFRGKIWQILPLKKWRAKNWGAKLGAFLHESSGSGATR